MRTITTHAEPLLAFFGIALVGIALAITAWTMAARAPVALRLVGPRGQRRQVALVQHLVFAAIDPWVRWWVVPLHRASMTRVHAKLAQLALEAAEPLGLNDDELVPFALVSSVASGLACAVIGGALGMTTIGALVGLLGGPLVWCASMRGRRARRFVEIEREMPALIDLTALCMGAGLDFVSSLRLVVEEPKRSALRNELRWVMCEIELGCTRRAALQALVMRAPTRSITDLVAALVQAEEKGTAVSEVLRIQAGLLRNRRSVLAEEAAARAGVWMMLPLLMLLACVMLIAMGGMVIRGVESGL